MYQDVPNTGTGVGFGKQNTQIIVNRLRDLRETNRAAQISAGMDINGFKDWFLPSKDELNLMYVNLKQKGLGGFGNGVYCSSSQFERYSVWIQRFSDGLQGNSGSITFKNNTFSVRAVRAF